MTLKSSRNETSNSEPTRVLYLCWGTFASYVAAYMTEALKALPPEIRRFVLIHAIDVLPTPPPGLNARSYTALGQGVSPRELARRLKDPDYSFLIPWFEQIQGEIEPTLELGARQPAYAMIGLLIHMQEVYSAISKHIASLTKLDPRFDFDGPLHVIVIGNAHRSVGPVGIRVTPALVRKAMDEAAPVPAQERLFSGYVLFPGIHESVSSEATTFETLVELDYFAKVDSKFRLQVPKGFAPEGYLTATGPLYQYMYLRSSLEENGRSLGPIESLIAPVAMEALQLGLGTLGIEQLKRSNNVVRILNEEVEKNEI